MEPTITLELTGDIQQRLQLMKKDTGDPTKYYL